jgi:hypothetical protein
MVGMAVVRREKSRVDARSGQGGGCICWDGRVRAAVEAERRVGRPPVTRPRGGPGVGCGKRVLARRPRTGHRWAAAAWRRYCRASRAPGGGASDSIASAAAAPSSNAVTSRLARPVPTAGE